MNKEQAFSRIGIPPGTTDMAVMRAIFKNKIKKLHPDSDPNDPTLTAKITPINDAWDWIRAHTLEFEAEHEVTQSNETLRANVKKAVDKEFKYLVVSRLHKLIMPEQNAAYAHFSSQEATARWRLNAAIERQLRGETPEHIKELRKTILKQAETLADNLWEEWKHGRAGDFFTWPFVRERPYEVALYDQMKQKFAEAIEGITRAQVRFLANPDYNATSFLLGGYKKELQKKICSSHTLNNIDTKQKDAILADMSAEAEAEGIRRFIAEWPEIKTEEAQRRRKRRNASEERERGS